MPLSVGDTIKIKKIQHALGVHYEYYNNISTFLVPIGNHVCAFIPHHLRLASNHYPLIILFFCDIEEGIIQYSNAILIEKNKNHI